jgi:hypothetical protein
MPRTEQQVADAIADALYLAGTCTDGDEPIVEEDARTDDSIWRVDMTIDGEEFHAVIHRGRYS